MNEGETYAIMKFLIEDSIRLLGNEIDMKEIKWHFTINEE
jgi:hypothetical protein